MNSIWDDITAVIFDMDGLLVDTEPLHYQATNLVLEEYGKVLTPEVNERFIGLGDETFWSVVKEDFGITDSVAELRRKRIGQMLRLIDTEPVRRMPGAAELVRACRERSYRVAVASSTPLQQVYAILESAGIRDQFEVIVSGEMDEVREGKPAPDIFLYTAELLNLPPRNCLVLEDSSPGVIAASTAGMRVVAVPNEATRTSDFSQADLVIESLAQLDRPPIGSP
jgi:HAD superfamily hydrolase (TIGR01509 family)